MRNENGGAGRRQEVKWFKWAQSKEYGGGQSDQWYSIPTHLLLEGGSHASILALGLFVRFRYVQNHLVMIGRLNLFGVPLDEGIGLAALNFADLHSSAF